MTAVAAPPAEPRGGSSVKVVFTGLMLVLLMAALDQTIVSTALPTIVGDLGGLTHISWVVTAYLLAQTVVITNALSTVFVVAAAIAAVAFLLSWLLEQRPLRDSVTASTGIGETFAAPKDTDPLAEASRALTVLVGREGRRQLVERLAVRANVSLSPAACWLVVRLHEDRTQTFPPCAVTLTCPRRRASARWRNSSRRKW